MNIILLILGAFLIIFSIIKIIISLNNKEVEPISETSEKKNIRDDNQAREIKVKDIYDDKEKVGKNLIKEEPVEEFKIGKNIDFTTDDKEEDLFKDLKDPDNLDVKEEYIDVIETKNKRPNMTYEIINMYEEGLPVNEIAKRLKKGIREIEIILKINKIN